MVDFLENFIYPEKKKENRWYEEFEESEEENTVY